MSKTSSFYTLAEASKKSGKTENEALRLIQEMEIAAWTYGSFSGYKFKAEDGKGPDDILAMDILRRQYNSINFRANSFTGNFRIPPHVIGWFMASDTVVAPFLYDDSEIVGDFIITRIFYRVSKKALIFKAEDIEKILPVGKEAESKQITIDSSLAMVLDKSHPWHSEPLATAVNAWLDLYSKREGNKLDNSHRKPGGNTRLINDWIDKNLENIGESTRKHYRVIINPSKQGGPTKSHE
jgi:hypothetical protein